MAHLFSFVTAMPLAIVILRKEVREMEKYEAPEMEIVEFETEDVITASGLDINNKPPDDGNDGMF